MSYLIFTYVYFVIGTGFAIAANESEPDKWKWWGLVAFVILWPGAVAYAIGKIKV